MKTLLIGVFLATASVVEATDVKVVFQSDPPGAMLYEQTPGAGPVKQWGNAPFILKYKLPKKWTECLTTNPVQVRWLSGATSEPTPVRLCPTNGKTQNFTFMRPTGVPGVEIDGQFAAQLLQQQAAAAAQTTAVYVPPVPIYQPRPQVHCTSTQIGQQVFTNCY